MRKTTRGDKLYFIFFNEQQAFIDGKKIEMLNDENIKANKCRLHSC